MAHTAPISTLFPYTTLFRSYDAVILDLGLPDGDGLVLLAEGRREGCVPVLVLTARDAVEARVAGLDAGADDYLVDRKSTRLNSSHQIISYAVFCLKKKTARR